MIEKRKPAIRQRPIQVKFFVDEKELSLIKARMAQGTFEMMCRFSIKKRSLLCKIMCVSCVSF